MTIKTLFFLTKRFWLYWFPVIFCCVVLYIQSSHAAPQTLPQLPFMDKFLHFFAYGFLGALFFRALRHSCPHYTHWVLILLSITFTGAYGMSDEIHQMFVASRSADAMDWLADVVGGTAGVYGFFWVTK